MKKMFINHDVIDKTHRCFNELRGLIGKVYDENFQIIGFYTSGRINNDVFITLTQSSTPCYNKSGVNVLKFVSEDRIVKFISKFNENSTAKYVERIMNQESLTECINELKNDIVFCNVDMLKYIVERPYTNKQFLKQYKCEIGKSCKFKNFLTRVKNYYGNDCKYYLVRPIEF